MILNIFIPNIQNWKRLAKEYFCNYQSYGARAKLGAETIKREINLDANFYDNFSIHYTNSDNMSVPVNTAYLH